MQSDQKLETFLWEAFTRLAQPGFNLSAPNLHRVESKPGALSPKLDNQESTFPCQAKL